MNDSLDFAQDEDMAMTPIICRNGWEMQVASFPDRKKLALTITPVNGCQMFVLGYFNSDAMAKCFEEFIDGDIDAWLRECAEKSNVEFRGGGCSPSAVRRRLERRVRRLPTTEKGNAMEKLIELVEKTACMLRGMTMDPAIPKHAKDAMRAKVTELEEAAQRHANEESAFDTLPDDYETGDY